MMCTCTGPRVQSEENLEDQYRSISTCMGTGFVDKHVFESAKFYSYLILPLALTITQSHFLLSSYLREVIQFSRPSQRVSFAIWFDS